MCIRDRYSAVQGAATAPGRRGNTVVTLVTVISDARTHIRLHTVRAHAREPRSACSLENFFSKFLPVKRNLETSMRDEVTAA